MSTRHEIASEWLAKKQTLCKNHTFSAFGESALNSVIDNLHTLRIDTGEVICTEGDQGDTFYVIHSGSAQISTRGKGVVAEVGPGDSFGEHALLTNTCRSASVTAETPMTLYTLSRESFDAYVAEVMRAKRIEYESLLARSRSRLLQGLSDNDIDVVCSALRERHVPAGDLIMKEGQHGNELFIILKGDASLSKQGLQEATHLQSGDHFGEFALLPGYGGKRQSTVRALTPVTVLTLDQATFKRFLLHTFDDTGPISPYVHQAGKLMLNMLVGAASSSVAGCITNPVDVVKTEMQLRSKNSSGPSLGMFGTLQARIATRGVLSLWAGVPAMILRSFFYAGIRLGAYEPIKHALGAKENPSMLRKVLAATLSGSMAATAANPIEVIKTRMQAEPNRYSSTGAAFASLARKEGLRGFSQGLVPHVLRGAIVTASQLAVYDEAKQQLIARTGLEEGIVLRFSASMVSGIVTTTASSPCDVVKTRMMTSGGSIVSVVSNIMTENGPRGFFKGWVPNYTRLGPHTVIVFMVYEQIRLMAGLGAV